MATLLAGLVIAVARLALELNVDALVPGGWAYQFGSMNFLTFSAYFFLVCVVIAICVSLATQRPDPEKLRGLTLATISKEDKISNAKSYSRWDVIASVLVLIIVVAIMILFNGR